MKKTDIDTSKFERVVSVEHLMLLVSEHRSCYNSWSCRIIPAAALANWQAKLLHDLIMDGRILIYPKPERRKKCTTKN